MEISPRNYKRKVEYVDIIIPDNIKYQKTNNFLKCQICSDNINSENNMLKSQCSHFIHIHCMTYSEIIDYIYYGKYKCKICNLNYTNCRYLIHSKKDILELVDMYFSIFKLLLKNTKMVDRDYYEYKRSIFYIIVKKIEHNLDIKVQFLDNINRKFIIPSNKICDTDILITKFDYVHL